MKHQMKRATPVAVDVAEERPVGVVVVALVFAPPLCTHFRFGWMSGDTEDILVI